MATVEEAEKRVKDAEAALAAAQLEAANAKIAFRLDKPIADFMYRELETANDAAYDGCMSDNGAGGRLFGLCYALSVTANLHLWTEGRTYALNRFAGPDVRSLAQKLSFTEDAVRARLEGKQG